MGIEMPNFDKVVPEESGAILDSEKKEEVKEEDPEKEKGAIDISPLDSENRDGIEDYYQFELDNDFSKLAEGDDLASMVEYRQGQIRREELKVLIAKKEGKLVGTTVVVLKDGEWEDGSPRKTMGKVIDSNEAHLAGILVDPKSTEQGLGEKIYQEADEVARKAGKKFISTVIDDNNYASMRLNFKSGYVLEGERENKYRKEGQPIEYMYKKDLEKEDKKTKENYLGEVKYRNVDLAPDDLEEDSARQVLINPEDTKKMKQALELGYLGKFLFRKEEHQKNDQSLMLFEK